MKNSAVLHSFHWFASGLALAFGILVSSAPASSAVPPSYGNPEVYQSYKEFAQAKGYLSIKITTDDKGNKNGEEVWLAGTEPFDDLDEDGLNNEAEFEGGMATVNGVTGYYSYRYYGPEAVYLGPGSNPSWFDSDADGISDEYEIRYLHTNPNAGDTDGDGIPDAVEAYAGLEPCNGGCVYQTTYETVTFKYDAVILRADGTPEDVHREFTIKVPVVEAEEETGYEYNEETGEYTEVSTGKPKMTIWHPDFDIDGDGLSNLDEVKGAIEAGIPAAKPETPFPFDVLNNASWTSPVNCDTDGDWLLDSFEKVSGFGLNPTTADDWNVDPDGDGLVTFREQCLHPLLSMGWASAVYLDNQLNSKATWAYPSSTFPGAWKSGFVGWRFSGTRILNGTHGYLHAAQYSKPGDSQRYYNEAGELVGSQGDLFWKLPAMYWTSPKLADSDGDDLPDGWEVEHGLNPLATDGPSGTLGDPDQDGLVNYEEYWGQDGHRIDRITGTGDETIPWVGRGLNYPNQSQFDDYLSKEGNQVSFFRRELFQAPSLFALGDDENGMDTLYSEEKYPGFFESAAMLGFDAATGTWSEEMAVWWSAQEIPVEVTVTDEAGHETTEVQNRTVPVKTEVRNRVPVAGSPAPCLLNDMAQLAEAYGDDFMADNNPALLADGEGAFQPFSTSYEGLYYAEAEGAEDGRYTPGVDAVWYAALAMDGVYQDLKMNGDLILADPNGILVAGTQGYPVYDNIPLMMPMPGRDTDNDGLPDSMEIQMDVARDRNFSSPVSGLSPMVARSARIVDENGMQAAFTTDLYIFSRQFTVEAWVYLAGDGPAEGTFVRGSEVGGKKYAFDLGVKPLRVGGTVVSPVMVDTVPYFGFHTMGGKWYEVTATQPLPRGKWVHLAGTYDPDKNGLALYIDGTLEQARSVQQESYAYYLLYNKHGANTVLTVGQGADFPNRLWMDEVRVWGVERTAAEINANFNHLLQGYQKVQMDKKDLVGGLMAYYPFDDGGTGAADQRHRALSSLHMYDYPEQGGVANALKHEYFYPDMSFGFPVAGLGGGFVFDAGNVAPVSGALDAQQGEYDSDGDGLPDSFELQNGMNPFSWITPEHKYSRYDAEWALLENVALQIRRDSLTEWKVSLDYGLTWESRAGEMTNIVVGGVVTQVCNPYVVLAWSQSTNTSSSVVTNEAGEVSTNTTQNVTTDWVVTTGDVMDTIQTGETWWVARSGTPVAKVDTFGKVVTDGRNDNDGDGLNNLYEYWARTNPNKTDTDEDGMPDGEEDFDEDGLPNAMEVDKGSRPDLADTDDDGYDDLEELAHGANPVSSKDPAQSLAAYFDGKPGTWLAIQDATKYALENWTIEAKIEPAGYDFLGDGQSASILRRGLESATNGIEIANYELRVVRDGDNLYPMARYAYKTRVGTGVVVELRGTNALPTVEAGVAFDSGKSTHLAVSYSLAAKRLRLYVDGTMVDERQELTASNPSNGEGPIAILRIGEGFRGFVDDVRVWSAERSGSAIQTSMSTPPSSNESGLVANFNFDDGGWGGVLDQYSFAEGRYTNILYSVKSLTPPAAGTVRDGDTWVDGDSVWICDAGQAVEVGTVADLGGVFCEGKVNGVTAAKGMFGWSHVEQMYYRYDGSKWIRWGKTPMWLSDVRSIVKGKISSLAQMLNYDPTPGDQFIDDKKGVVYIYRETLPMDRPNETGDPAIDGDWYVAELEADPMMPGHRFYLQSLESIVEWDGAKLTTIVRSYDVDGLVVTMQSDGMAYKSDAKRKYFRKWGAVPSLEDSTVQRGWESGWTTAAKFSGGVQLYRLLESGGGYVPIGGEDTDGDGLPDEWEVQYGLDPTDAGVGGKPGLADVDGDGQVDYTFNLEDFVNGPWGDPDNDGLHNRAEYLAGTNPNNTDTDGDGTWDYDSSRTAGGATFGSLYMDGDDMPDAWESLFPTACSPLVYDADLDPDGDGWDNYSEYMGARKTQSANVYEVTTNADGTVSSNFVSASGWYVPYCLPDDPAVYPQPEISFNFKVDCNKKGTLRIYAYTDRSMTCADAETSYALTSELRTGQSLDIVGWMDGGHLRQGDTYFMAFIDENNDGQWNDGEVLGFSENMPENISWGKATINIALTQKASCGYPRFSWAGATSSSSSSSTNGSDGGGKGGAAEYAIIFKQGNTVMFQHDRAGCKVTREFFHEYDFMAQPEITGPLYGVYSWSVTPKGETQPSKTGNCDLRSYPETLAKPVVLNPKGTLSQAKQRLRMKLDPGTAKLRVVVKSTAGKTVIDETIPAPYVDADNQAEIDFPQLLGWGALTNGAYTIQVNASNPAGGSATSAGVTFTVALDSPNKSGAAMVSGTVKYFGFSGAADRKIVVEAFATSGFDQKPIARTLAKADGSYQLMGLPSGSTYVRAFLDLNGNGVLDPSDPWTILKGAPEGNYEFKWVPATIRGLKPKGGTNKESAVSPYATDYSAKNVFIQAVQDYSGNDMVLHDADTDGDGLSDAWELFYVGNLNKMNQYSDTDKDGLLDIDEFLAGTNPTKTDTDGDGLSDADEVKVHKTDPKKTDTDGDGIGDAEEVDGSGNAFDGKPTNPTKADTDGDGLSDYEEVNPAIGGFLTNPNSADTDGDGMDDDVEIEHGYNPTDPSDGLSDDDEDGLDLAHEILTGADPENADTDGDGWLDGEDPSPTDANEPLDEPDSFADFHSAPVLIHAEAEATSKKGAPGDQLSFELTVRKVPIELEVQSTGDLTAEPEPEWTTEYGPETVEKLSNRHEVLIPAPEGSGVKYFRVWYSIP